MSIDTRTGPPVSQPVSGDKLDRRVLIVAGVVVLGAIMSILDITVVSVALKTFQNVFEATPAQVAWTMTGHDEQISRRCSCPAAGSRPRTPRRPSPRSWSATDPHQIRTRSSGASHRPSSSVVPNAWWNSSRLRTMLARNSAGLCGSMVSSWSSCSLRRLVRQQ